MQVKSNNVLSNQRAGASNGAIEAPAQNTYAMILGIAFFCMLVARRSTRFTRLPATSAMAVLIRMRRTRLCTDAAQVSTECTEVTMMIGPAR